MLATHVTSARVIAYDDCTGDVREIEVRDLPAVVANDTYGRDLEEGRRPLRLRASGSVARRARLDCSVIGRAPAVPLFSSRKMALVMSDVRSPAIPQISHGRTTSYRLSG